MKKLTALLLFAFIAMAAAVEPAVPGYTPTLRLDAKDAGIILRHGDGPNQCDINGAREPTLIEEGGKYHLFYDGGGPKGWLACLATSSDLKTWTKHGPVLDFGKPGEPDAGSALSPWFVKEGDTWHMYYVTAAGTAGPPGFVAAGPYNSGLASSKSLMGPWVKTKGYIPVKPNPPGAGYPQTMAYPGHIVKKPDGEFLMFFGSLEDIGIARTRDLLGDWKPDAAPLFDKHFDLENSSLYFEPENKTWFLFVNHIKATPPMFTDATWVFWTKDLERWSPANRAIALDGVNCTWSKRCIGMATVTKVGNRLAMVYDAAGGESTDHLGRDIGLAWYDLPLAPPATADLLVLMHDSGKVERYDAEGKHMGAFITGLPAPNALMEGPDGRLYVSTGVQGANGTVERFDAKTGLRLGPFINIPAGQPGHLARATGMTWHEGDLLVASQGDGVVKRFDGKTGAWKSDVAKASLGGFTQIAMREGRLFLTDFVTHMIRVSDMKGTEAMAPAWTHSDGDAAWGLVFDAEGRAFWSTGRQRILRFDGKENVAWAHGLATPVWLSLGPDGLLYAVNHTGPNVTVWNTKTPNPSGPVRVIGGPEMKLPIAVAFTSHPFEPPVQVGNFTPKPSNSGRDWTPDGTAIYNLRAMKGVAAISDFGLDTEGGDRAKLNLLKEPMRLIFTMKDGSRVESSHVAATSEMGAQRVKYVFGPAEGISAEWVLWLDRQNLRMSFAASGANFTKAELLIPFDPRAMGTTVLAEEWGKGGVVKAPLIISALDMGQLHLRNDGPDPQLDCTFIGSRQRKRIDLRVEVLNGTTLTRSLVFAPAQLKKPNASLTDAEWAKIRRGLISLLQITSYMVPFEDGSGWLGSPGGILGNNVISDPVTCNMDRNLQWLAGMGDKTTVMGINLNRLAKHTIEFWLNHRMNEDGSLDYVLQKGNISADSNTGVLNSATDYFLTTGDTAFVRDNKAVLLKAVNYFIARDLDADGLIETFRDGNGNNQFGDTGYDTISSGWKNALVNGQAYKSFLGVAKMMESIGEEALAKDFRERAGRLRKAYNQTFYDAEKGRYIWWIGKDGKRHDYSNPLIQANAVLYGIAECLEQDTGLKRGDKDVMQALWDALDAAEYRDTAKGKTVDYMDAKSGNSTGLYWGIPGNLEDVPDAYNFQNYGSHEFPYYCNGCIFPSDTVTTITAFAKAGMKDKAALIQRQIFKRQHEGIFPNGSGFYMGVVNGSEPAYSILKWDGTPTDYEGIISRDCSFLQTVLLTDDPARELFQQAATQKP